MKLRLTTIQQLLLTVLLALPSLQSIAFGTLFTSPAQRDLLDNRRQNNGLMPPRVQDVKIDVQRNTISFEGLVIRKKGPVTLWLNGKPLDKGATNLSLHSDSNRAMGVSFPSKERSVLLKPGQKVHQSNGDLTDAYQ